jgi:chromosome segregation ATPase
MVVPSSPIENAHHIDMQVQPHPLPQLNYHRRKTANFCGREVTKCGAHMIFGAGYLASGGGIAYAIAYSVPAIGAISAVALCIQAVAHRWWTSYSNLTNASEDVQYAAVDARSAATSVHHAAAIGSELARRVSSAAYHVEQGAERISLAVGVGRFPDVEASVADTLAHAQHLAQENVKLQEEIDELKSTLSPLMGIVGSFRTSLVEIRRGFKTAGPQLQALIELEQRFSLASTAVSENVCGFSSKIQELLERMSEEALITLQILRDNHQAVMTTLEKKNQELKEALAVASQLSGSLTERDTEIKSLVERLEAQGRQNVLIQERVASVVASIDSERESFSEAISTGASEVSSLTGSLKIEREQLAALLQRLQSMVGSFGAQASIEVAAGAVESAV